MRLGLSQEIPREDVGFWFRRKAGFWYDRIFEIEQETVMMVALTRAVSENLVKSARVHWRLDSSTDVVDITYGYLLQTGPLYHPYSVPLHWHCRAGRGSTSSPSWWDGPTGACGAGDLGLKLATWYSEMKRNIERFEIAAAGVEVGKILVRLISPHSTICGKLCLWRN